MSRILAGSLLLVSSAAHAAWPEDVTISEMTDHAGSRLGAPIPDEYRQLMTELGTAVANKPYAPADTLGAFGFDWGISNAFGFIDAHGEGDHPSVWQRAVPDEDPGSFLFYPGMSFRKGFAGSLEAGMTAAWVGLTRQATFGGYGRVGIVEGWKPFPDVTVQVGYAGYVGNPELDMGVVDLGVRLGSTFAFGTFPGVNTGQFAPWFDYSMLRVSAVPHIDGETARVVGAVAYGGNSDLETVAPLTLHRLSGGFQITNGTVYLRTVGSWTFGSAPGVTVGMGFTY